MTVLDQAVTDLDDRLRVICPSWMRTRSPCILAELAKKPHNCTWGDTKERFQMRLYRVERAMVRYGNGPCQSVGNGYIPPNLTVPAGPTMTVLDLAATDLDDRLRAICPSWMRTRSPCILAEIAKKPHNCTWSDTKERFQMRLYRVERTMVRYANGIGGKQVYSPNPTNHDRPRSGRHRS